MKQVGSFNYKQNSSSSIDNFYVKSTADNDYVGVRMIKGPSTIKETAICNASKYSIFEIANWFLMKENMTHKKLQKLCYYAQAWCFALKGYKLANTDFQAWIHGPVSPALYERFKGFGYETIRIKAKKKPEIEEADIALLEDVWETYGDKTGNALEALSHRETPWIDARKGYANDERCSVAIDPQKMKEYYLSVYSGEADGKVN